MLKILIVEGNDEKSRDKSVAMGSLAGGLLVSMTRAVPRALLLVFAKIFSF